MGDVLVIAKMAMSMPDSLLKGGRYFHVAGD
jgi:hypothetical protein